MISTSNNEEYERFLEDQSHVKDSTLNLMRAKLKQFPEPDKLTGAWFRKRMKEISPTTVKTEVALARRFLKWSGRDTSELEKSKLKLPRIEESVTVADLYTKDELAVIFASCIHTRDRAMLEVLYESAARASEILSMSFKNTTFNEDGTTTIIIKGKTGTRPVPLFESVPALKTWLNAHPIGKGPIWCSLRRPHNTITSRQLYQVLQHALDRAGIKGKKRIVHMLRHTRATELVRLGIRGQVLSKLLGWTKKSNMEAVYVHLSTEDVTNEVHSKVFGIANKQEAPKPLLESSTCPRCNTKNTQDARICSNCNMPLSNDAIVKALQEQEHKREEIEQMVQERVDEAMQNIVQSLKSTKTLKELAVALAREMGEGE